MTTPSVSFEFFPPRDEAGWTQLWGAVEKLAPFRPSFVSVTYGAGGTTRERTDRIVRRIRAETPLEPAAHITCVGAGRGGALSRRIPKAIATPPISSAACAASPISTSPSPLIPRNIPIRRRRKPASTI